MSITAILIALQTATLTISAEADVTVSNGRNFTATMRYAAPDAAEYHRRRPDEDNRYVIAPDGVSLTGVQGREPLDPAMAIWILSHNFHAQLLDFDRLNRGSTRRSLVETGCDCLEISGKTGAPALGITHLSLVVERDSGRARKLLVHRKDAAPVVAIYSNWRTAGNRQLPFAVDIDDGKDRYAFRFTRVKVE